MCADHSESPRHCSLVEEHIRQAALKLQQLLVQKATQEQHSHLEYYLDEFTFRFNRRTSKSRGLLFYRLISQAIDLGPVLETDLKNTAISGQKPQESTA